MAYDYARRDALAKERGFRSYSDQRKQFSAARKSWGLKHNLGDHKLTTHNSSKFVQNWYKLFHKGVRNEYPSADALNDARREWAYGELLEYEEENGLETTENPKYYS